MSDPVIPIRRGRRPAGGRVIRPPHYAIPAATTVVHSAAPLAEDVAAIGLVRIDLSRNIGLDLSRVRLIAGTYGLRLVHILVTGQPSLTLLLATVSDAQARAIVVPQESHVPTEVAPVLGISCRVLCGPNIED